MTTILDCLTVKVKVLFECSHSGQVYRQRNQKTRTVQGILKEIDEEFTEEELDGIIGEVKFN